MKASHRILGADVGARGNQIARAPFHHFLTECPRHAGDVSLGDVIPSGDEDTGIGGEPGSGSEVAISKLASSGYLRGHLKQLAMVKGGAQPVMMHEEHHDTSFEDEDGQVDLSDIRASVEAQLVTANPVSAQVASIEVAMSSKLVAREKHAKRVAEARMKGFEGDSCGACGNFTLVRNGTCMKCNTCGSTSGCS